MKTFVLDTNIILHDAHSIFKFGQNEIVLPAIVLEELDSKKRNQDEVGRNARAFSRILDDLRDQYPGKLNTGVPLENGGILRIELNHISFEKMEKSFNERTNDNRIIAVAMNLQEDEKVKPVDEQKEIVLVTNDMLAGIKGDTLGINIQKYENDRLIDDLNEVHKGYHEVFVPNELIDKFYDEDVLSYDELAPYVENIAVYPQDFFILKDQSNPSTSALGRLFLVEGKLRLGSFVLDTDEEIWGVKARNVQQRMLLELLMDPNVELVCGVGKAGTGKTLLALAAALAQTEDDRIYKKILVARPVIPMGKDIGYLPGDMNEKLRPWMQPIYDNLEFLFEIDEETNEKNEQKTTIEDAIKDINLEVEALTYIRGRSIPKQFLIIDEAQNLNKGAIKTIISRAGEGTKVILLGDPDQIDDPYLDATNNALTYVVERMKDQPEVGVIRLEKTERSNLAEKAAKML